MKKALQLLLMFIVFLIIGLLLGTLFYSIYLGVLSHIVGTSTNFFVKENLMSAFFLTGEILAFILGLCIISYRIRHPGGVLQLIAFIITQVLCWGILFPSLFTLEDYYKSNHQAEITQENESHKLTKGFFRRSGNIVYYFMDDAEPSRDYITGTTTVKITTGEDGKVSVTDVKNPKYLNISSNAEPYKDILIKNSFENQAPDSLSFFYGIVELARDNFHKGWTFWLGFMSLGFALACVYGLSHISNWRLISFSICSIATVALLYWNYGFFTPFAEGIRTSKIANIRIDALSEYVGNQFLILTNLLLGIMMIVIGIISHFVKKHHSE